MKIFTAKQIKDWDQHTIENEPISSVALMERTSQAFTKWFTQRYTAPKRVIVFCGIGNNGGDGLVISRILLLLGYQVHTYVVRFAPKASTDFEINFSRLQTVGFVNDIYAEQDMPELAGYDVVIDAIFGSGLSRPPKGLALSAIQAINKMESAAVISVDIASGLYADKHTPRLETQVVHPSQTVSFQTPKLAFFIPDNEIAVGDWQVVSIRLSEAYEQETYTPYHLLHSAYYAGKRKKRLKFSHKGTYGHVLLMAGSRGKMGATLLSAKATLKSGAGLLTAFIPEIGYTIMQTALPEVMCLTDKAENKLSTVPALSNYNTIAVGPGLGKEQPTVKMLGTLLNKKKKARYVFDADALNILSENPELLKKLPKESVLTPHPKEFERLAGKTKNQFERLTLLQKFCKEHAVYVVLKGAHSAIGTPKGKVLFNTTGNAGMATAGSGDVLTGVLAGLLAQEENYSVEEAVCLGVYLHGLAADLALAVQSVESMIASDITEHLGKAFNQLI